MNLLRRTALSAVLERDCSTRGLKRAANHDRALDRALDRIIAIRLRRRGVR